MRIGIDCRTILNPGRGERAGIGHYTYYLVKNLLRIDRKNQYVLFFDARMDRERVQEFEQSNVTIRYFPFSQYRRFLPVAYSQILTAAYLYKERLDLYHAPATSIPLSYRGRSVATVHDLAIYKHPRLFPSGQFLSTKLVVPKSIRRAKKIIAVSEATKRDLKQLFHVSDKKIRVVYEGFVRERPGKTVVPVREKYGLGSKLILFIGTIEPRKNLPGVIRGFASVAKLPSMSEVELVLAGAPGWKYGEVIKAIRDVKLGHRVRYLGYIPHTDKVQLLEQAMAFVFPSLYEGFGLPVLEAMSLGTPVITSNVSSLPEVAGTAAVFINPKKPREIGLAMSRLVGNANLRKRLASEGQRRAAMFTWDGAARETLQVYREVFTGSRPAIRR